MFEFNDLVKIIPLSKKMKDRVSNHGKLMRVIRVDNCVIDGLQFDLLLESLNNTFSGGQKYSCWIKLGRDCLLEKQE